MEDEERQKKLEAGKAKVGLKKSSTSSKGSKVTKYCSGGLVFFFFCLVFFPCGSVRQLF